MARKFLSGIDLVQNEITNVVIHNNSGNLAQQVPGQLFYDLATDELKVSNGSSWTPLSLGNTTYSFSISDGAQTTAISNAETVIFEGTPSQIEVSLDIGTNTFTLTNLDRGSSQNIFKTINADSGSLAAGSNNSSVTITGGNSLSTSISGSTLTVDLDSNISGDKNFLNNVVIQGNLTVNGTTTTVNSETVTVTDNLFLLNSGAVDNSLDAGWLVERGAVEPNVGVIWDESSLRFRTLITTDDGSTSTVTIAGHADLEVAELYASGATLSSIPAKTTAATLFLVSDAGQIKTRTVAQMKSDLDIGTVAPATTTSAGIVTLATNADARSLSGNDVITASNLAAFKAVATITGDNVSTTYGVTHNLDSFDVIVQLYDTSTGETVIADVIRNTVNQITVTFGSPVPDAQNYKVLIYRI